LAIVVAGPVGDNDHDRVSRLTFHAVFAAYLRELQAATGLTRVQFAERLGVSQSYLSEVLLGDKVPSMDMIESCIDATGQDVPAFLRAMERTALSPAALVQPARKRGRPTRNR